MIWLALWGRLRTFGGWAARNPLLALCGLLALFSAYAWHGWSKSEARRKADAVAFQTASDEARRQQVIINHEPARKSAIIAERSNADAPAYYERVRRAADAHRVPAQACRPVHSDLPGADHAAALDDGPAPAADMVARSKADDDLILAAAGRAAQMHQDALALIAAGVAVPSIPIGDN